ncbi:hypothetical protein FLA105534_04871 [Flavobacterium bizetiae]|uniref:Uncharacterized protein n=1 Tax=Flavobacterium bizetiae TaxID=2704140 RepID=A0A6J4H077_9FLAO|nr:DUF6625 family protein [Flavobacterium bizetiae]CAA9203691.1 hypothetical protein FLA105534_04871 [Flavobacterium bizetiae]CAD5344937.1 hypothetical protein FLA105535_04949 [Flavobacterium bizetiae]CAD5350909.1 hypothetical protein FLA105534_04910 [Flavobacterium bizetiae]
MKKIALVNCYFGEFPWYFPFFIKSCATNPTIDFLIFSDRLYTESLPDNVKIIPFNLDKFNALATEKLGFEVSIEKAYKLCDFKPAYGLLFSEYLQQYDFWGITDIDVIYGRIREFMTDEILDTYDIICVRHDFITACCMLFKNNDYVNTLFKKSKDYQMVFTSTKNFAFDETNFEQIEIVDRYDIFNIDCEIESMQHVILKEEENRNLKSHFDLLICDGNPGELKWENGLLSFRNKLEILLFHMQYYKKNIFTNKILTWDEIPDSFYIDRYNYRKNNSLLTRFTVFYTNYLTSPVWHIKKRIGVFLSFYLFKNKLKHLEEGEYIYYLSKEKVIIRKDHDGSTYIKFKNDEEQLLYHMAINKNYFFAKELHYIFKLEIVTNNILKAFTVISPNGTGRVYTKSE